MGKKEERALALFKEKKAKILEQWLKDIEENPRFSSTTLKNNQNLPLYSDAFLSQVLGALESGKIPDFSKKTVEPVLGLWHHVIKDQMSGGFSTKDTAVLIYSLKTSLQTLLSEKEKAVTLEEKDEMLKLEHLLDVLGILTFEMYSVENEKLITRQNQQIQYLQSHQLDFEGKLIGSSRAINEVYKAMGLILENDLTVLLEGESGTGKDVIATMIHRNSKRKKKPFIAVNCGAIPRELIESELFGHEKGAFTGAYTARKGRFELAEGGTLFLDEIGETNLATQVKLLRVLQEREFERVGGIDSIKANVRLVVATNKDLEQAILEGSFRADLHYRLNVFTIFMRFNASVLFCFVFDVLKKF